MAMASARDVAQGDAVLFKVREKLSDDFMERMSCAELKAAKSVLVKSSDVFEAMFRGRFSEGSKTWQTSLVELTDTSKDDFSEFLRYMNVGKACMTLENATGLLYLAHKYMVTGLKQLCYDYIYSQLDADNFENILHISNVLGSKDFDAKVMLFYRLNAHKILRNPSFVNITKEGLLKLVSADKVNIREIEVFRACMRWADAKLRKMEAERQLESEVLDEVKNRSFIMHKPLPSRKKILGEQIVKSIRFSCMPLNDFNKALKYDKLLTSKEISDTRRCINKASTGCIGVGSITRQSLWETCVDRTDSMKRTEVQKVAVDDVSFEVKSALFLTAVGIYGRKDMNRADIEVTKVDASNSILEPILQTTGNIGLNSSIAQKITFEKPVKLQPFNSYQVKVVYFKDDSKEALKGANAKAPGSPYRMQLPSKICQDVIFKQDDQCDQIYSNIPHIYFIKI